MAQERILILQGHPDPRPERYCRALAAAYAEGARGAGHEVREFDIGAHDYLPLRGREAWEAAGMPEALVPLHEGLQWCDHLLFVYPMWMGDLPAHTKAALEWVLRPGSTAPGPNHGPTDPRPLAGRSAHVVVTMGMPGFFYRWFYGAHSLKSLERNVLRFIGFSPVRHSLVGLAESQSKRVRERWLQKMRVAGEQVR
jgi:putative NADPH-quinone reductase